MTSNIKVRSVRFSRDQEQEEVSAIIKEFRPDREVIGLPEYVVGKSSKRGRWYAFTRCGKCGDIAKQQVDKLVNYNLGCIICRAKHSAGVINEKVAKRVVDEGRVSFTRDMDPVDDVAAIMKEHRPDRKILESPFYKLVKNKNSGYWYVKNECGDCGHVATQKVYILVNNNAGCNKCKHGRL